MLNFEVLSAKTAANFDTKMRERYFSKCIITISVTQGIEINTQIAETNLAYRKAVEVSDTHCGC